MSDEKNPLDKVLDVVLYAPIGLALNADEMVRQMAARGRQSVAAARFIGQMAVNQGRTEIDKALVRLQDQAAGALDQLGGMARGSAPAPEPAAPVQPVEPSEPRTPTTLREVIAAAEPDSRPAAPGDGASAAAEPVPPGADLDVNAAIPDFDSLAASQVVPRLAGLSPADLEVIRRYETGHRGRKTILHRIDQLQG